MSALTCGGLMPAAERAEVDALVRVMEDAPPGSYVDLAMHILRCGYERTQTAATPIAPEDSPVLPGAGGGTPGRVPLAPVAGPARDSGRRP